MGLRKNPLNLNRTIAEAGGYACVGKWLIKSGYQSFNRFLRSGFFICLQPSTHKAGQE